MTIRSQHYIINPVSACPSHLSPSGGQMTFDIDEVANRAWGEILQTAPASTSLFNLFEDLLVPGADLIWKEGGPGRGTEMRRAFSGLFGRFFARAYLSLNHGAIWFAAIDGNPFKLSSRWQVTRKPGSTTEMPDWICAGSGFLAIAEAKGSHGKTKPSLKTLPGPIKTAAGQIGGVLVQKLVSGAATRPRWRSISVKGWAVMSRWGVTTPFRSPYLYAYDPETDGDALTAEDADDLAQAIARTHVAQLQEGLGTQRVEVSIRGDKDKQRFSGAIISPFGRLDVDLDTARLLALSLPNPDMVRYVGLRDDVVSDFQANARLGPVLPRRVGNLSILGGDGLIVAPLEEIVP